MTTSTTIALCYSLSSSRSLINYPYLIQCTWMAEYPTAGALVLGMWLLVLLYFLSSTADGFLCPCLQVRYWQDRYGTKDATLVLMLNDYLYRHRLSLKSFASRPTLLE